MNGSLAATVHLLTTFAMAGLIWFVQIVHYPMMANFERENFAAHEKEHCDRTGWVVVPLMLGEIFTFALLLVEGLHSSAFLLSGLLLGVIWASTFFLQVPLHRTLLQGWNDKAHRQLVATNWIRTVAWSGRAILLGWIWTA
ncbi:MAG: hypothetical protein ACKOHM_09985 [Spartobacteria bacterium]